MKTKLLALLMALMPSAHAAELPEVCYPTSVQCSEDKKPKP